MEEFGKPDKAQERNLRAYFIAGDPYRDGSFVTDKTNLENWFRKYEDLRNEIAGILDDKEAVAGLDSKKNGFLTYEQMLETVLTIFGERTSLAL